MATTEFTCRACNTTCRSPKKLEPGTMVRCPKCALVFRLEADAMVMSSESPITKRPAVPPPPAARPSSGSQERSNSVRRDADDDRPRSSRRDDDDRDHDRRPARRKKRKQQSGANAGLIVGVGVGIVALLLLGIGGIVAGVLYWGSSEIENKTQAASNLPRAFDPANPPGIGGQTPSPRPGGGQFGPGPGANLPGGGRPGNGPPSFPSGPGAGGPGILPPTGPGAGGPGILPPAGPGDSDPSFPPMGPSGPRPGGGRGLRPPMGGGGDDGEETGPITLPPANSKPVELKPLIGPPPIASKSSNDPAPSAPNGLLPKEILSKVKKATVYVRISTKEGVASGSGFFAAGADNMVLTNAHVVGMLQPDAPAPKNVEVVLNSGEGDEATFNAEVLAVDRISDLAVLKISPTAKSKNAKLPEALAIAGGASLQETQQVYVFGFPLGEGLGKNITVSQSSVSSLRKTPEGELDQIQVNGGMHHGNSGGPVVDAAGNIVGVAVAGIEGTTINFAVPAERVSSILDGRLSGILLGEPVSRANKTMAMAIEVEALDPLNRIKDLKLDWWWGASSDKIPAMRGAAPAMPAGTTARQSVALKRASNGRFTGEITFPSAIPANKVLWLQPNYANANASDLYVQGVSKEVAPPPELRIATLAFRPKMVRSKLKIEAKSEFTFRTKSGDGKTLQLALGLDAAMTEEVIGVQNDNTLASNIKLDSGEDKISASMMLENKPAPGGSELSKAADSLRNVLFEIGLDVQGSFARGRVAGMDTVPEASRKQATKLVSMIQQSLEFASIPLPNGQVRPGQTWQAKRNAPLAGPTDDLAISSTMTYTYRGIRVINKKSYGVISLSMRTQAGRGREISATAVVNGSAVIDLATGRPTKVSATIDSTLGLRVELSDGHRETVFARSKMELKVTRQ